MPFGKNNSVLKEEPFDQNQNSKVLKDVFKGNVFGFVQVDIEVPDELYDKQIRSKNVQQIPACNMGKGCKVKKALG